MCSNQNNEHRGTIVEHISEMKDTIGTRFCWDTYLVQCCTRLSGFWRKLVVKLPLWGAYQKSQRSLRVTSQPRRWNTRPNGHLPRRSKAETWWSSLQSTGLSESKRVSSLRCRAAWSLRVLKMSGSSSLHLLLRVLLEMWRVIFPGTRDRIPEWLYTFNHIKDESRFSNVHLSSFGITVSVTRQVDFVYRLE